MSRSPASAFTSACRWLRIALGPVGAARTALRRVVVPIALLASLAATTGCDEVQARRRIQDGNKLYGQGKYEQAIAEYEKALASQPQLTTGWYNLGLTHLALFAPGKKDAENEKHAQGAIKAFNTYLEKHPKDLKARDYLLSTYIDSGHYEGALAYFEKQLQANPKDMQAMAQMAQINAQAGKYEDAARWHRKQAEAEETSDAKADALYSIGVLSWRRLNGHLEVMGPERAKIADEGLAALLAADKLRANHHSTIIYTNLLYRERSLAHEASYARAIDAATAQIWTKKASELAKAQAAASPAAKPGDAKAEPQTAQTAGKAPASTDKK